MKKLRKIAGVLLALAMVVTMLPATAFAAETDGSTTVGSSGIVTSKTTTLENDGTYTINLEAYATGETQTIPSETSVPLDIVLVIDQSGSMYTSNYLEPMKEAVSNFVESISDNAEEYDVDHRIAIVGYASNQSDGSSSSGTINGSTSSWINTGLYVNGEFKNYGSTSWTTYEYTEVYDVSTANNHPTYYVLVNGEYRSVTYTSGGGPNSQTGWYYTNNQGEGPNSSTRIYVTAKTSAEDTDASHTQFYTRQNVTKSTDGLTAQDYKDALVSVNDDNGAVTSSITTAIDSLAASGATRTSYGMIMANNIFANNEIEEGSNRQRIVVVFTDGQPGFSSFDNSEANSAISESYTTKNTYGATVYTVGLYSSTSDSNVTNFMNYLSSNYPYARSMTNYGTRASSSNYYYTTSNAEGLNSIFQTIFSEIQNPTTTVTLDEDAVLKDIMAEGFSLASASVSVKTVAGTTTDDSSYSWGTETADPAGVSATMDVDTGTVSVTGFDYAENYITTGHAGAKLVVTITGVIPTDDAITGSAVATNATASGIYENDTAETAVATFPVPETILTSKAYVLDYAKTAELSGLDQDQSVTAVVDEMAAVSSSDTSLTGDYGKTELEDSTVSYTPTTTNWNGYDSFYVFGKTSDTTVTAVSANTNGNLWSKVSVIPANNVYYEDDFITSEDSGTVGIVYTGTWTTDGTTGSNTETANGDVQGWETSLADDETYSDGSAHKAVASDDNSATATFTFTGTGVDVYSRTDMTTGSVLAMLTGEKADGTAVSKMLVVDNYAESYTGSGYYQIPTLSFDNLDYGTYTVTIYVTSSAGNRATYYLDGIRIYNPIWALEKTDETVQEAYGDEIGATFTQVRDMLEAGSTVFIDEDENGNSYAGDYDQSTYEIYGPENEVYLASGQSIVFQVTGTTANSKFYVGMKAPNGTTSVEYSNGTVNTTETISHASDLYYEVTPGTNGYVVIKNTGNNLLSVTKLRITSGATVTTTLDTQEALDAYNAFTLLSTVTDDSEGLTEDEVTDVDTETTEDTEVDVVIENPDSYENQDSGSDTGQSSASTVKSVIGNLVQSLFNSIKSLFSR